MHGQDVCFGRESKGLTIFSVCFVFLCSLKFLYRFWEITDLSLSWNYTGSFAAVVFCIFVSLIQLEGLNLGWDFVLNNIK